MTQTRNQFTQDAEKKRRKYLRKKATGWGIAILILVTGCFCLVTAVLATFSVPQGGSRDILSDRMMTTVMAITVPTVILLNVGSLLKTQWKAVSSTAYVSPVREKKATYSAKEVLVRSSDQPTTAPNELLRPAENGNGTATHELLRPESAPKAETLEEIEDRTA